MSITIDDVAKHAGVSTATISRYINHSNKISEKTKKKVKASMDLLNYQPSVFAQGLAGTNSKTIAFVINVENETTFRNHFFSLIQFGIEQELASKGYYLLIVNNKNINDFSNIEKVIKEKRVAGIILPTEICTNPLREFLKKEKFPYVILGYSFNENEYGADINNYQGGFIAAKNLIDRGSKNIAYISPSYNYDSMLSNRYDGFTKAMIDSNNEINEELIYKDCNSKSDLYTFLDNLIDNKKEIDGIISTDDKFTFLIVLYLLKKGYKIPDDIQLIGFDDTDLMQFIEPNISVINVDVQKLGKLLGQKVVNILEKKNVVNQMDLLNCELIKRGTLR